MIEFGVVASIPSLGVEESAFIVLSFIFYISQYGTCKVNRNYQCWCILYTVPRKIELKYFDFLI